MKTADKERPVLVSMGKSAVPPPGADRIGILELGRAFAWVRMPMSVREEIVVLMEMEMATMSHQLEERPDPDRDHRNPDATFGRDRESLRQRASEKEQAEPNSDEHESVPERPAQSGAHSLRDASFSGREYG